jgi:hypothetical protein
VLRLVREEWCDLSLSVAMAGGSWYIVQPVRRRIDALSVIGAGTEAEALVLALEAAPVLS